MNLEWGFCAYSNAAPGGGAAYITINSLLVWLPVALVVNAASLAAVYWFATSYEGPDSDRTQHSMLACASSGYTEHDES